MTVDRSWIEMLKDNSKAAFLPGFPTEHADLQDSPTTIFIDGQLRMQMPAGIQKWSDFVQMCFLQQIEAYLKKPNVIVVVLAFDNHDHTPAAKGPTQAKRRSRVEVPEWDLCRPLPSKVPDNYNTLLFNRTFKAQVIAYIIDVVMQEVRFHSDRQRVVIDYKEDRFWFNACNRRMPDPLSSPDGHRSLGECDVKFVHYISSTPEWGNVLVLDACDSDYVMIGCLQQERLRNADGNGTKRIFVKRYRVASTEEKRNTITASKVAVGQKRLFADTNADAQQDRQYQKSKYEYVDCTRVMDGVRKLLQPLTPAGHHEILPHILMFLVAFCGCDFVPGLPYFTAKTFLTHHRELWPRLCTCITQKRSEEGGCKTWTLNAREFGDEVILRLWKAQFKKILNEHVSGRVNRLEDAHRVLVQSSSVSTFRKDRLLSPQEIFCYSRCSAWTVKYWADPVKCPDPVSQGAYGYRICEKKRKVVFDLSMNLPKANEETARVSFF